MLRCCLSLLDYPRFIAADNLPGQYNVSFMRQRVNLPKNDSNSQPSVLVSVMYPSESPTKIGRDRNTTSSYWRPAAVDGISEYSEMPPFIFRHLASAQHPCRSGGSFLSSPDGTSGWPVVVFSHGLAGCADMYSQVCRCLASFGYIVCAIEHEDGSGCHADDAHNTDIPIRYKQPPSSTPYTHERVSAFRRPFFDHRINEIRGVISQVGMVEPSSGKDNGSSISSLDIHTILSQGDPKNISLMGHSFGGATMSLASQTFAPNYSSSTLKLSPLPNNPTIKSLIVLDPWAFSLDDEVLQTGLAHIPTLSILSHGWITGDELPQIAQLLRPIFKEEMRLHITNDDPTQTTALDGVVSDSNAYTAQKVAEVEFGHKDVTLGEKEDATGTASYFLPNTVHQSFSDSPLWYPSFLTERFNMKGVNEIPQTTHLAIAEATNITIKAACGTLSTATTAAVASADGAVKVQRGKGKDFLAAVRLAVDQSPACQLSELTWFHPSEQTSEPSQSTSFSANVV